MALPCSLFKIQSQGKVSTYLVTNLFPFCSLKHVLVCHATSVNYLESAEENRIEIIIKDNNNWYRVVNANDNIFVYISLSE